VAALANFSGSTGGCSGSAAGGDEEDEGVWVDVCCGVDWGRGVGGLDAGRASVV